MNGLFSNAAARAAQHSAHASLADLTAAVGVSGLAAAQANPGLMSAIDQHAASIRDSLHADSRPLTAILLAAYAEGVRDAAFQHGWNAPENAIDWSENDWVLRRLLAICMLARSLPAPR